MSRLRKARIITLLILLSFVVLSSASVSVAEFYSLKIYPVLSYVFSLFASVFPFSLDEWVVLFMIVALIAMPFIWRLKCHRRWSSVFLGEMEMILWIYVWFYMGWGINYYREDFFTRLKTRPAEYDEKLFKDFLFQYTDSVNKYYHEIESVSYDSVHKEIKSLYGRLSSSYGFTAPLSFQYPKKLSFNSLYSGSGVLGFMGPFFAESHINNEMPPLEYPFTYAHELSHLLGVSNEAEANFWAYQICTSSDDVKIKYSGYFGLFSYVLVNARGLLSEDDYKNWLDRIRPEVKKQFNEKRIYWSSLYSPTLGKIQSAMYEMYLKGNRISSGQKNYAQVVGLLLSVPEEGIVFSSEN